MSHSEQGEHQVENIGTGASSIHVKSSHSQAARFVLYGVAALIVCMVFTFWLSGVYAARLEAKIYEATAQSFDQLEGRIAELEQLIRPERPRPLFVDFKPALSAPRLGDANAKVEIIEFADYQCPFCSKFHAEVYSKLKAEYVDTGKASFVYQDFALLGEESFLAAEAARCARDQGKFWQYHDYLFTHQTGENEGGFTVNNLKLFAKTLGLTLGPFNACMDTKKYRQAVVAETAAGEALGFSGTPTIVINGQVLVGALSYDTFTGVIDEALGE